jgi:hypothetical protein
MLAIELLTIINKKKKEQQQQKHLKTIKIEATFIFDL